jgi:hypothetical protein
MKKIFRTLLLVISGTMVLVAGILVHAGLFARVEIHEKQMGPYLTVYKPHVGGYHKISKIIDEFDKILGQEEKIEAGLSFEHYFDNPIDSRPSQMM